MHLLYITLVFFKIWNFWKFGSWVQKYDEDNIFQVHVLGHAKQYEIERLPFPLLNSKYCISISSIVSKVGEEF